MKIKNIIKSAVKAKVAAKIAAKTKCKDGKCCDGGKCSPCAIALALIVATTLCGCGTTTPSRSQTLTMKDCTVNIYGSGDLGTTNDVARVDIASQNMMIENSGTETQTATPQYTTDVKPDIDVAYNDAIKSATDASKGILEKLTDAGAATVLKLMSDKSTGAVVVPTKDGGTMTVKCENGQCSECTDCTP